MKRVALRKRILHERETRAGAHLDPSDPQSVAQLSAKVVENLVHWLFEVVDGKTRMGVLPNEVLASYRVKKDNPTGEVDLSTLALRPELGKTLLAYPRVVDRFLKKMDFAIPQIPADWITGVYEIPEPRRDLPAVEEADLGAVLVPGLVFGEKGERLGMGAGYYDRYLDCVPGVLRIGIAFDFQVLSEDIPQESWDARMDVIVTESRVLEISEKSLLF